MKGRRIIIIQKKTVQIVLAVLLAVLIVAGILYAVSHHAEPSAYAPKNMHGVAAANDPDHNETADRSDKEDNPPPPAKLAIIIDDIGSTDSGLDKMLAIKEHLTFAVMPFLENTERDAVNAYENGMEVIVHLPMEANGGKISWVGPKPIMSGMTSDEIKELTAEAISNVPHAVGANIHMGSRASSNKSVMSAVLGVLKEKNMFFVDSRTTRHPIGKEVADEQGVLCYDRDVFLDGKQPKSFVVRRLRQAGDIALKKGFAVAIGHAGIEGGDVTAEAITEIIPEFEEKNIQLVFVSELNQK
jgi:hypothetical protein